VNHQHSYSLDSLSEYVDVMTNGTDGVNDAEMSVGSQPTPLTMTLELLHRQMAWLTGRVDELDAENTRLRADTVWLRGELNRVEGELHVAQGVIAKLQQIGPQYINNIAKDEAKGADPPIFISNQRELEGWITACRLRFAGQPSKFGTEEKKVIFATTFMRGPPMA
jgi:hypothetical protein